MTDNTFTRVDLSEFDDYTPDIDCVEATWDEQGRIRYTFNTATYSYQDAKLFMAAAGHLAALRAAYAENDRLQSQLIAVQEDAMSTPERIDLSKFPHGGIFDELRRSYDKIDWLTAEIDRLRANALEWVTVTEDKRTLPQPSRMALFSDGARVRCGYRDALVLQGANMKVEEIESWFSVRTGDRITSITAGHRWAYIPEEVK